MFLLYEFVSDNFVNYYIFSKPHFCKKYNRKKINNKNEENISIIPSNSISEKSKKSTIISLFIDESENINELDETKKSISNGI